MTRDGFAGTAEPKKKLQFHTKFQWVWLPMNRRRRFHTDSAKAGILPCLEGATIQGDSNPGGRTVTGWRRETRGLFRRSGAERSGGSLTDTAIQPRTAGANGNGWRQHNSNFRQFPETARRSPVRREPLVGKPGLAPRDARSRGHWKINRPGLKGYSRRRRRRRGRRGLFRRSEASESERSGGGRCGKR